MSILSIERREIAPQPFVFVRTDRVSRDRVSAVIGEGLGKAFGHVQQSGLVPAGPPVSRYPEVAGDVFTIECGVAVSAPAAGSGDVRAGTLQGGPVLVALHAGSYDELPQVYAAMERWIAEHGTQAGGAPWEVYLTDPGALPNPADWRTEVYWPLAQ